MALLIYSIVEGDREQWFWGLVWAQKVEQLNAAPAAPLTASDPLFSSISTAWHQPVFSRGILGEENNHLFSLTADWLIEVTLIGQEMEGFGNWDQASP